MNRIENEISRLLKLASDGALPGYPEYPDGDSFFAGIRNDACGYPEEYFSGENDALERRLRLQWKDKPQLLQCIPVIIAAVEKSRSQTAHHIEHTELYNYTI